MCDLEGRSQTLLNTFKDLGKFNYQFLIIKYNEFGNIKILWKDPC